MHFNLRWAGIEKRVMRKLRDVEVGAQLAIHHAQHVAIEVRRDAGKIVVGGVQSLRALEPIRAQQQTIVRPHISAQLAKKIEALGGCEITNSAAQKGDQIALCSPWQMAKTGAVVAAQRLHVQPVVGLAQTRTARQQHFVADVKRHIARVAIVRGTSFEQMTRLARHAAAKFDYTLRPRTADDVGGDFGKQRILGSARVILRHITDLVE